MCEPNPDMQKKINNQVSFCRLLGRDVFIMLDGYCYKCGKNIFENITEQEAGSKVITHCSHCNASFVE